MGAKALIIGLEALGPSQLDAMIDRGAVPALAALKRRSAISAVENYPGLGAGAYWPSLSTGTPPGVHGRVFHVEFVPRTYGTRFRDDTRDFPVEAFWNDLDRSGRRVAVLDWAYSPIIPVQNGVLLDAWLVHEPQNAFRGFPKAFEQEIKTQYGLDPWAGGNANSIPQSTDEWRRFVDTAVQRIRAKTRYCVGKLREGDWDLFAPCFSEAHDVGHYALHFADPALPQYDADLAGAVGDPMLAVCRELDAAVAALIEAAGPSASVVVIGGPGIEHQVSGNSVMDAVCRRLDLGYGGAAKSLQDAQAAYRAMLPFSVRSALSPIVRRLRGQPPSLPELAGRRFFPVPHSDNSGAVRVNLKGREAYGAVQPQDFETVLGEIAEGFRALVDPGDNRPVVAEVVFSRDHFAGPQLDKLPDVFIVWRRDAEFRRVGSPKVGVVENPPLPRPGDHSPQGFLWSTDRLAAMPSRLRPHETTVFMRDAAMSARSAAPA